MPRKISRRTLMYLCHVLRIMLHSHGISHGISHDPMGYPMAYPMGIHGISHRISHEISEHVFGKSEHLFELDEHLFVFGEHCLLPTLPHILARSRGPWADGGDRGLQTADRASACLGRRRVALLERWARCRLCYHPCCTPVDDIVLFPKFTLA